MTLWKLAGIGDVKEEYEKRYCRKDTTYKGVLSSISHLFVPKYISFNAENPYPCTVILNESDGTTGAVVGDTELTKGPEKTTS